MLTGRAGSVPRALVFPSAWLGVAATVVAFGACTPAETPAGPSARTEDHDPTQPSRPDGTEPAPVITTGSTGTEPPEPWNSDFLFADGAVQDFTIELDHMKRITAHSAST